MVAAVRADFLRMTREVLEEMDLLELAQDLQEQAERNALAELVAPDLAIAEL